MKPFSLSNPLEEDKNYRWLILAQVGSAWITVGGENTREEALITVERLRDGKRRFRIREQS